jgi:hypothetical protein
VICLVAATFGSNTDLLFKKLWTISPKAEFMLGIGPEWVYLRQSGKTEREVHQLNTR